MSGLTNLDDLAIVANPLLGTSQRAEIVFIESDVQDIGVLLAGIDSSKEVHIIDASRDGLQQIADILQGRSGIDALHIVTHGSEGEVGLGSLLLDSGTAATHAAQLQTIGQSLNQSADVLLYGCNVGAGNDGHALIDQLALLTGADIAASSNPTGAAALGGDWDLEVRSGNIDAKPLVDADLAAAYRDVLALSNQTVNFETTANFVSLGDYAGGAGADVTYRVNNNGGYVLKIDGAVGSVYSYVHPAANDYTTFSSYAVETALTISFQGGNLFTATSLALDDFGGTTGETLVFKGYNASNVYVSTAKTTVAIDGSGVHTVNFTGAQWANIASIKITQLPTGTSGTNVMNPYGLDNLVFSAIQAAGRAPAAPSRSAIRSPPPGTTPPPATTTPA
jgi:hypothetical protein